MFFKEAFFSGALTNTTSAEAPLAFVQGALLRSTDFMYAYCEKREKTEHSMGVAIAVSLTNSDLFGTKPKHFRARLIRMHLVCLS